MTGTPDTTGLDSETAGALADAVTARRQALIELTRALVAQRSVLGDEAGVQQIVEDRLEAIGCATERVPIDTEAACADPAAGYPTPGLSYTQRTSVVGHLPGTGGGRSMHLSGHVDVVPVERPDLWTHDPWAGEIIDGRMYGRGASDMKGGVAAYLIAAEAVTEVCPQRRGELIFSTVIEEECTGNGMWSVLGAGHVGDAVLVGESTELRLVYAATGVVWCRLVAKGGAGHSMLASGAGAFDALGDAVDGLRAVEAEINDPVGDPDFAAVRERPYGMTVGRIGGGVWTASTPYELTAWVRFGFGPETTPQEIQERMRAAVHRSAPEVEIHFEGHRAHAHKHPLDGPLVDALRGAHEAVTGSSLQPLVNTGTVDTRFVGEPVQSYCYGGTGANLHGTDEWVDLDSLLTAATVVARTTATWTA
jgi:acetylornithine deacetylase